MHDLVIVAMFKNESMIIKEWIEHYNNEGVDHFYLIDNGSTDDYFSKIEKYADKITIVKDPYRKPVGTQTELLNKHFLDIIKKEAKWVIVIDIDEYIYSRNNVLTIRDYIKIIPDDIFQIILPWKMFGSNYIIKHPSSIIKSFTKRETYNNYKTRIQKVNFGHTKSLTRVSKLLNLETHMPNIKENNKVFSDFNSIGHLHNYNPNTQYLHLNHYTHLSHEYYHTIKIIRGGGQGGIYTSHRFIKEELIFNVEDDNELKNKTYSLLP